MCVDGADDSDCDDGSALDFFDQGNDNDNGRASVAGLAGGLYRGDSKKSSFRSDSARGSGGVRFSDSSGTAGGGKGGGGRVPTGGKKNDSVSDVRSVRVPHPLLLTLVLIGFLEGKTEVMAPILVHRVVFFILYLVNWPVIHFRLVHTTMLRGKQTPLVVV